MVVFLKLENQVLLFIWSLKWHGVSHQSMELCVVVQLINEVAYVSGLVKTLPRRCCVRTCPLDIIKSAEAGRCFLHVDEQVWVIPSSLDPVIQVWSWIISSISCWGYVVLHVDFQGCQLMFPQSLRSQVEWLVWFQPSSWWTLSHSRIKVDFQLSETQFKFHVVKAV